MKRNNIVILSIAVALVLAVGGFFVKQYYHYSVCNFESRDGESHSYHVLPETTADSLLEEVLTD